MLTRLGLRSVQRAPRFGLRSVTTKTTITDHLTGETIKLTDPKHPQYADYPNVEPRFASSRDPYATYDFQQLRRNKNEPMNIDEDMYDMWSPDYYQFVSDKTALKHNGIFLSLFIGFGLVIAFGEINPEKPAMPRSYPYNGLAKSLGSADEATDYFYRVRPDETAEAAGILADDVSLASQEEAFKKANPDFFSA
ncbi:hypothetical protein JCM33374_g5670 [Metschnikowia sp. JCM 33374]|nr:hypothetical protein JCM33374_g5670 [Metschnikowia sp. JCM 33374]